MSVIDPDEACEQTVKDRVKNGKEAACAFDIVTAAMPPSEIDATGLNHARLKAIAYAVGHREF